MGTSSPPAPRSYLYVPADKAEFLEKAARYEADALIIDLEDSVAASAKASARDNLHEWLVAREPSRQQVIVRVTVDEPAADLLAISRAVTAIMVPKAEPARIAEVSDLLAAREADLGIAPGSVGVIALVETARGLQRLEEVAAHPRVVRFGVGRADLFADLRLDIDPEGPQSAPLLLPIVIASSAAGLDAPIAPTSTRVDAPDELARSTREFARWGFRGRTAIHPRQLSVVNEAFSPNADDVAEARRLIDAHDRSQALGAGVFLGADGRIVDAAVVRGAYETLARA